MSGHKGYTAQRALIELDRARAAGELPEGTGQYPMIRLPDDETQRDLPALLLPQAE